MDTIERDPTSRFLTVRAIRLMEGGRDFAAARPNESGIQ
jgi:hypothetical protein